MKEVKVTNTLLKEYNDGELVHFLAAKLKAIAGRLDPLLDEENVALEYGNAMTVIAELSEIASAVDKRMNNTKDDPKIVI